MDMYKWHGFGAFLQDCSSVACIYLGVHFLVHDCWVGLFRPRLIMVFSFWGQELPGRYLGVVDGLCLSR